MRIALAGNPNSGKTTMYNALTGSSEKVGNWAGVTVERKEHPIKRSFCKGNGELIAVDLPGAYSMSPFTSAESITSSYVREERPDAIINIVDSTNLSRSLFFTTQLLELGIPTVVALNKTDANEKKDNHIDSAELSKRLGCPVVETASISGSGLDKVVEAAVSVIGKGQKAPYIQGEVDLTDKAAVVEADKKRFIFVNGIVRKVETRRVFTKDENFQDKVDEILTNKWLGIPIFAVVMFLVFQISQAWLGAWIADGIEFENGFAIPGLVTLIDAFKEWVAASLESASVNPFLGALLTGIIIKISYVPALAVIHKIFAVLFMALIVVLVTYKHSTNKET